MILRRGAISLFVVAVLCMGAATTAACTKAQDDPSQIEGPQASETDASDGSEEDTTSPEDVEGEGIDAEDGQISTSSSDEVISSQDLAAIGAELAAMERELDTLVFPDDDFSDIEALLDQ